MTEDGVRTRRNFPAETWAVVRDAYLGGETAESISRRLNISINTIRTRAARCGWTHVAHARAIARSGDYVVCLGAGNITSWAHALPEQLTALQKPTTGRVTPMRRTAS